MRSDSSNDRIDRYWFLVGLLFTKISKLAIERPNVLRHCELWEIVASRKGSEFEFVLDGSVEITVVCGEFYLTLLGGGRERPVQEFFWTMDGYEDVHGSVRWE